MTGQAGQGPVAPTAGWWLPGGHGCDGSPDAGTHAPAGVGTHGSRPGKEGTLPAGQAAQGQAPNRSTGGRPAQDTFQVANGDGGTGMRPAGQVSQVVSPNTEGLSDPPLGQARQLPPETPLYAPRGQGWHEAPAEGVLLPGAHGRQAVALSAGSNPIGQWAQRRPPPVLKLPRSIAPHEVQKFMYGLPGILMKGVWPGGHVRQPVAVAFFSTHSATLTLPRRGSGSVDPCLCSRSFCCSEFIRNIERVPVRDRF